MNENPQSCGSKCGILPQCAPLAAAFVPKQQDASPRYEQQEALARGTLFPGLDLPFMNMVNTPEGLDTPLAELMAIDFVTKELNLYLDTHAEDAEAFALLKSFLRLGEEARSRYVKKYGVITVSDLAAADRFTWLKDPWPWDYSEGGRR